jgi:signal transduction histidine kinase
MAGTGWLIVAYQGPNDFAPFVITVLIGEMAATAGPRFGLGVALTSLGLFLGYAVSAGFEGDYIWGFAFVIAWMGGTAYRRQVAVAHDLSEAQVQLAASAAEEERHRLAREIHDLIAHSLAVTMLQLSGARLALAAGETDEALDAIRDAEAAGRAAMAEIHRTVGLLGTAEAGTAQMATPSATDIPGLVNSFQKAGLSVDLDLVGDLDSVPMATGLAAYRVVQESLSNVVKHAPGAPVQLRVAVLGAQISIHVVNPVVGFPTNGAAASGHGLRGMTERAELLGGTAHAGNGDGTWKVDAVIPWQVQPA